MSAGARRAPRRPARRPPELRAQAAVLPRALGRPRSRASQARSVLGTELRGILRDRRALFAGVVLPVLLYPLIFLGQGWLDRTARESIEAQEVRVLLALDAAPPELAAAIRAGLEATGRVQLVRAEEDALARLAAARDAGPGAGGGRREAGAEERRAARELLDGRPIDLGELLPELEGRGIEVERRGHALLEALPGTPLCFLLYADRASERAGAARERIRQVLEELARAGRSERITRHLGADPAAGLALEVHDVASAADRTGSTLGRLLPLLAVLVVLSGASFAALSAFAGEREGGTLETLLVQPVPARALAWGKLAAVALVGVATLGLNVASVLGSLALGLGEVSGLTGGDSHPASVGLTRFALASVLLVPLVLLLAGALSLLAVRARSFREGQHYVLPLILCAMPPVALGAMGDLELDVLLALVPLTGATLAVRDALAGSLAPGLGILTFLAHGAFAALCAALVATRLDAERLLAGGAPREESARRQLASRDALRLGWAAVIGMYLVGGFLQAKSPVWGLAASLWLGLLPLAIVAALALRRRLDAPLTAILGLRRPRFAHLLGALLLAPGLARAMGHFLEWQMRLLPLPQGPGQEFFPPELLALGPVQSVLLLALTPAICEELFFRGSLLSGLRRDLSSAACVGWQALLFGLAHASIHRLAPTALLGALLALVVLRARSLWVAVVLHGVYNGWLVTAARNPCFDHPALPFAAALGALLLLAPPPRAARDSRA